MKQKRKYYIFPLMKKIAIILAISATANAAHAEANWNPFFGTAENQIAANIGQGVNSGIIVPPPTQFVPFNIIHLQYSQPTTFFKLPARQSMNVAQTIGYGKKYGWNWNKFSIPMIFASGDVALFHGDKWYFGPGAGVGLQAQQNDRISTKLLFQFKITGGYRITDNMNMELYIQHFSNANTGEENHSYAFYGAGVTYNF